MSLLLLYLLPLSSSVFSYVSSFLQRLTKLLATHFNAFLCSLITYLSHIYQHSAVSGGMHLQLSFEGKGMKRGQRLIYIRKMRMGDEGTMSGG